jgi:ubiquinone/menaquinone biosynthesis C-methylase UbiE
VSLFKDGIGPAIADFLGQRWEKELAPHRRSALANARGRVLEIGAGTGFNVAHYPDGVDELVMTEPGAGLLRRAERRAGESARRVTSIQAFAEKLPFEDDSFDTVVSTLVLCSVRDQDEALAEIRRVLKPGGEFLFMEHVRADDEKLSRWQDRLELPWRVVAMGCHPNRATLERIEAAGFEVQDLRRGELPKVPPIARPMILGRAVAVDSANR